MKKILILFLLICLSLSCGQTLHENAFITLMMTDEPAIYDEVWIDIKSVEIKFDFYEATDTNKWYELTDFIPGRYNLLDYANGQDTLLVSSQIPTGTISQIRLILGDNNYIVINQKQYSLNTPSANQSGVKINVHESFEPGIEKVIWLDFNAAKSIVETGNGKYQLKPVIRSYTAASAGAIKGLVNPKEALPFVFIVNNSDTIGTIADTSGYFMIGGVPGGIYTVFFDAIEPYLDKNVENVVVSNGKTVDLGEVKID